LRLSVLTLLALFFVLPLAAQIPLQAGSDAGEMVGGFPSWEERTVLELTNRARVEPSTALANCTSCSAAERASTCYTPQPPLTWDLSLNRSARFHSDYMARTNIMSHDTSCTLRSDLSSVYPGACDGSTSCACSTSGTTSWSQRISLFGGSGSAENVAYGYSNPLSIFDLWLLEPATSAPCGFTSANGHRWSILKNGGPSIGVGYSLQSRPWWTQDFGRGTAPSKIVSGAHWSTTGARQAASVAMWANWYDAAAPSEALVIVNGVSHTLTLARGSGTNGAWTTTVSNVGTGCHRYYFQFRDGAGAAYRYPTTGTFGIGSGSCADWEMAQASTKGDIDADGKADLIWRHTNGDDYYWRMNGASITNTGSLVSVPAEWTIVDVADLDGDGRSDLFWRNQRTGQTYYWLMNGPSIKASGELVTVDNTWSIAAVGDINGDRRADIIWRRSNGETYYWRMNGGSIAASGALVSVDPAWRVVAAADLNGDGTDDLFWRHSVTGQTYYWLMKDGGISSSGELVTVAAPWEIAGVRDISGDGKADVFWRNSVSGDTYYWLMNGGTIVSTGALVTVANSWAIATLLDLDGDGRSDVVWRNSLTGETYYWRLSGGSILASGALVTVADPGWKIAGPR
jgi:uncharacterized protein YkwD